MTELDSSCSLIFLGKLVDCPFRDAEFLIKKVLTPLLNIFVEASLAIDACNLARPRDEVFGKPLGFHASFLHVLKYSSVVFSASPLHGKLPRKVIDCPNLRAIFYVRGYHPDKSSSVDLMFVTQELECLQEAKNVDWFLRIEEMRFHLQLDPLDQPRKVTQNYIILSWRTTVKKITLVINR